MEFDSFKIGAGDLKMIRVLEALPSSNPPLLIVFQ